MGFSKLGEPLLSRGLIRRSSLGARIIAGSTPPIVTNGGFDSDTDGWSAGNATLDSVVGGQVGNCLRITNTAGATGRASQQLMIPAGTYTLTLYQKTGTGAGFVSVSAAAGGFDLVNAALNNGDWALFSVGFTCAFDNPWLNLWVNSIVNGQTTFYDEVSVSE